MSTSTVHQTAKEGFINGSNYDQYRPSYPTEMVKHLVDSLYTTSDTDDIKYHILELGAGTGLFTRKALSILPKDTKYLATDPSSDFLSVLQAQSPDLETKVMSASNIPLPDASVEYDAVGEGIQDPLNLKQAVYHLLLEGMKISDGNVVCAQCVHWFATEESLTEMTRVLVPHGRILVIYNNKNQSIPWLRKLDDILTDFYDNTPRKSSGQWKVALDNFPHVKLVEHKIVDVPPQVKGDKQFILNHFKTISVIVQLCPEVQSRVYARFQAVLDEYFNDGEEIPLHTDSEFYCVEKL